LDVKYIKRLKGKAKDRQGNPISEENRAPGPIVVELNSVKDRNWVLPYAKMLRTTNEFKNVYMSKDYTPTESILNYELRQERNKRNAKLDANSPKIWAINNTQLILVNRRKQ